MCRVELSPRNTFVKMNELFLPKLINAEIDETKKKRGER